MGVTVTNTALIGLDYIHDIVHPDGKIARTAQHAGERGVIANANQALTTARSKGWLTVLVKVGFARGYADQPKQSPLFGRAHEVGAIELDTPGTAFHTDLDAGLADLVIAKPRVSAFYGTNLDPALRARRIERLIVAGVSTSWAVQSTVRDAHDRDYQVLVLEDACAAANDAEHQASIDLLKAVASIIRVADLAAL